MSDDNRVHGKRHRYDGPARRGRGLGILTGQTERALRMRHQQDDPEADDGGDELADVSTSALLRELVDRFPEGDE